MTLNETYINKLLAMLQPAEHRTYKYLCLHIPMDDSGWRRHQKHGTWTQRNVTAICNALEKLTGKRVDQRKVVSDD